jgi:lipopolysaccharide export system ATP-binding protein
MLQTEDLCKSYKGRKVVDNVSLEVCPAEVVGLLGPNGAGKSTTFHIMVGLVEPDSGQVLLDGEDLTSWPMYRRARRGIGYLPQESSVFRKLTVEENLLAILEALPLSRGERHERLEALIEQFGLGQVRYSRGYMLSGGERRRVEIARSLVISPDSSCWTSRFRGLIPSRCWTFSA